jgi:hypothetical protein
MIQYVHKNKYNFNKLVDFLIQLFSHSLIDLFRRPDILQLCKIYYLYNTKLLTLYLNQVINLSIKIIRLQFLTI